MRARIVAACVVVHLLVGDPKPVARADLSHDDEAREAWYYKAGERDGWFKKEHDGKWIENSVDGVEFRFAEVGRTAEYVELFDQSRTMWLRLDADRAVWRQEDDGDWNFIYSGRWVAARDLPALAGCDHLIRLAYFVPTDREPTADYEDKIRVVSDIVAEVYRQDFESRGIPSKGLRFQEELGQPVVHLVRGKHPAAFYNGAPHYDSSHQYDRILSELPATVGRPSRNVIIAFAETYDPGPAEFEWPGGVALGGRFSADGGFALFSAWILRPEFCATTVERQKQLIWDKTPIPGRIALGNGQRDSPRFEFIEDGLGAVAHELGHALGLPHDQRQNDRDIMGNGFRNLRWNFGARPDPQRSARFSDDNARILYTSRYLAPSPDFGDQVSPTVSLRWTAPPMKDDETVTVAVKAADNNDLRAILFYSAAQDSVVGGRDLTGKAQEFETTLSVRPLKPGELRLEAFVADRGGNLTRAEIRTKVGN